MKSMTSYAYLDGTVNGTAGSPPWIFPAAVAESDGANQTTNKEFSERTSSETSAAKNKSTANLIRHNGLRMEEAV